MRMLLYRILYNRRVRVSHSRSFKLVNWLRVLGSAALPHMDQGVRQPGHANVSWWPVFKPPPPPLAVVLPRQGPLDPGAQGVAGGMPAPRTPARGARAVAWRRCAGGDHARLDQARALARGINAGVAMPRGSGPHAPRPVRHTCPRVQPLRPEPHRRFRHGGHGAGRAGPRPACLSGRGPARPSGVGHPSHPSRLPRLGHGVGPLALASTDIAPLLVRERGDTGRERWLARPRSGPCGQGARDGRGVPGWWASRACRPGPARPVPAGRAPPHAAGPEVRRAACARWTPCGPRAGRDETGMARGCGELHGKGRGGWVLCRWMQGVLASFDER